jgi:hypothetical protein
MKNYIDYPVDQMRAAISSIITPAKEFKTIHTFTDDHILCCEGEIDGKSFILWCCDWEGLAAMKYANESDNAKTELIENFVTELECQAENFESNEEFDEAFPEGTLLHDIVNALKANS